MITKYTNYLAQQLKWASNESATLKFVEGQRRYLQFMLQDFPRDLHVLDIGCGDGVGLRCMQDMGFTNVVGTDLCRRKLELAKSTGFRLVECDFHNLPFPDRSFDVVYSSHSLEHALFPDKVLLEIKRVLKTPGALLVVLPYPDCGKWNEEAHVGKFLLGTNVLDEGKSVESFFNLTGFSKIELNFDSFREPEIWITAYSS
jgi:ubiquinone/menaquinone biosynthesis C-methylase UbiE